MSSVADSPKSGWQIVWDFCGHFSTAIWVASVLIGITLWLLSLPPVLKGGIGSLLIALSITSIVNRVVTNRQPAFVTLGKLGGPGKQLRPRKRQSERSTNVAKRAHVIDTLKILIKEGAEIATWGDRAGFISVTRENEEKFNRIDAYKPRVLRFLEQYGDDRAVKLFEKQEGLALDAFLKQILEDPAASSIKSPVESPLVALSRSETDIEDDYYDRKPLKPNLVEQTPEDVSAHQDIYRVIVKGKESDSGSFNVLAVPFVNTSHKDRVAPIKNVSFRTAFRCYEGEQSAPLLIPRGSWLSEKNIEIDFPANCAPRSAIIATIEDKTVYAIRRDDSEYKGVITTREELRGTVFSVTVELLAPSLVGTIKKCVYILEVIRAEEDVKLKLGYASLWKGERLYAFIKEGYDCLTKIHDIWKVAQDQVPFPTVDTSKPFFPNYALGALKQSEPFDYAAATARLRSIEREQEEKLLDAINNWEARAADFVKLHISPKQHDQFISIVPSIEAGFNRAEKGRSFKLLPRIASAKDNPPELPYWTLYEAVKRRTDKLSSITDQL